MDTLGFDHDQQNTVTDIRWKVDYAICIIAFFVILGTIAQYTRLGGTIADDLLLKYEEKQYSLDTPTKNPACTSQTISLVFSLLTNGGIEWWDQSSGPQGLFLDKGLELGFERVSEFRRVVLH